MTRFLLELAPLVAAFVAFPPFPQAPPPPTPQPPASVSTPLPGVPAAQPAAKPLNAREFGAVGDGRTNDGPALQAAVNAAIDERRPLVIPRGNYLVDVDPVLVNGVKGLVISGPGRIVYGVGLYRSGLNCPSFDFRNCSEITIQGLGFLGTGQRPGFIGYEVGLRICCDESNPKNSSRRVTVRNCRFDRFRGFGMLVSSGVSGPHNEIRPVNGLRTADVLVTGNIFDDNCVALLTKPGGVARLRFLNNTVTRGAMGGIKLDGEGQAQPTLSGPHTISGNTFDDLDAAYSAGTVLQGAIIVEEHTGNVLITGNKFSRIKALNAGCLWINTGQTSKNVVGVEFSKNRVSDVVARAVLVRLSAGRGEGKISGVRVRGNAVERCSGKAALLNEGGASVSRVESDVR